MDLTIITKQEKRREGLFGIEKIMLCYWILTTLLIFLLGNELVEREQMLIERLCILVGTVATFALYNWLPSRFTSTLRILFQMALLSYWYPDTYQFNCLFGNLDCYFAGIEQLLFNCQPAVEFSKLFSSYFWCELFNLGYFSYFPMIGTVALYALFAKYHKFEKTTFIILCSFLLYYIIYVFIPVAGPQYYFNAIGLNNVDTCNFYHVGTWFKDHTEMLPAPGHGGFFQHLIEIAHEGERPTAAFPSSHVGISTILMILAYKLNRKLMIGLLPFYILLCLSTVYIQAHYAIDVIAGWLSAILVYKLSHQLYYSKLFYPYDPNK
ncbi:MAG: phosphatase PAP2 family protein [Bacteroidaceae bacterium]